MVPHYLDFWGQQLKSETRKMMKSGDKKFLAELELYERIKTALESGIPVRAVNFNNEEHAQVDQLFLPTFAVMIITPV